MTYPQDPQGWQQPGGYDPNGAGYGDPYAQPGGYQPTYDPTSGQPQPPPGSPPPGSPLPPGYEYQQPGYPTSGYPEPTSGYPGAPTSGYPTSGYPPGYPGAPTSGYPAAGYGTPGYGTGFPAVPPPKQSKTGLILGIVAGVVVLLVIVVSLGVWAFSSGEEPEPDPTTSQALPSPTASPSPSDPPLLIQFQDPDLREFARRAAAKADRCEVITTSIPAGNNAAEALKCIYGSQYQIYFLRYKTLADRDSYAQSARTGFSDDSLVVDGDTFWTDDKQARQGNFITGRSATDNGRYIYWDVPGKAVSGEIYTSGTDAATIDAFWRTVR
ncbi:hypothetical protein [Cryptosporangium aurantiacum]|uniref:Uncharacterized protein n=1 Tax=Cryptosporangium aurantiacum TaxID=134849 RepID=A0A1M7HFV1_9ACTN|nr:hypothetical protein [Cryptosporangium aurantiacum]SHM27320.1 hypothetical protein SAMN05443668_101175 [Cryptosporangium aurantiacum]